MSHLSTLRTQIRSLELARRALDALGIPVVEGETRVRFWYDSGIPAQADLVIGQKNWFFNLGLQRQADGTFAVIGDNFDMLAQAGCREMLAKLGPQMHEWKMGKVTTPAGATIDGHVMSGSPTLLMQEYALQVGEASARARGMSYVRLPQPNGDRILRITGGELPAGGAILLTAKADGTSTVGAYNIKGPSCKQATAWLEQCLGQLTGDQLTGEFYHETTRTGATIHVGGHQ